MTKEYKFKFQRRSFFIEPTKYAAYVVLVTRFKTDKGVRKEIMIAEIIDWELLKNDDADNQLEYMIKKADFTKKRVLAGLPVSSSFVPYSI